MYKKQIANSDFSRTFSKITMTIMMMLVKVCDASSQYLTSDIVVDKVDLFVIYVV